MATAEASSSAMSDGDAQGNAATAMALATTELEYRVELLNKFKEGALSIGENSCVDRCCSKYWQGRSVLAVSQMGWVAQPPETRSAMPVLAIRHAYDGSS
ncbi:mitochondrial inner membrane translocase [Haematococcus lacustris]|uniref:Mitochondrial import inner membrane translocase subunit n=1 Tax=Haematococcus lacustris TaxID=44745 RepID=A0A699YVE1_HAELA|nr:mitochondrial inner membrane translocase [Haematococcus lacustris]